MQSTVEVWQVLQVMMGSKTDKFMSGKGTEQIFGDFVIIAGIQHYRCCLLSFFYSTFFFQF